VNPDAHEVYLGDWVVLSVCHLDELLKTAAEAQRPVTLYIEGIDSGNQPTGIDLDGGALTFILDRNEKNAALWQPLLYNPLFERRVAIHLGVGIAGERQIPRAAKADLTVRLNKLYLDWSSYVWLTLILGIVILLVVLSWRSDMLREGPTVGSIRQPYSLGRTQMAWWFFLTIVGFSLIWQVTGDRDTIPASLLGLLGISAATALAAVAMPGQKDRLEARRTMIGEEIDGVDAALGQIAIDLEAAKASAGSNREALETALGNQRAKLETLRSDLILQRAGVTPIRQTAGWWRDLVSDDRGGVALDRFQVVAWSVVLGCLFLYSVFWTLSMPEFSATLLTLMGISSGTYIGFKLPQK